MLKTKEKEDGDRDYAIDNVQRIMGYRGREMEE